MEERYTFGNRPEDIAILERVKDSLTGAGFTCTVEQNTVTRHNFVLNTIVAVPPKKPTRKERERL